jgi:signal transduction histidine kinase
LTVGAGLIMLLPGAATYPDRALAAVGMAAIVWVFGKIEAYWAQEMVRRKRIETLEAAARVRVASMTRDAQLGISSRTIAHELANLITVLEFATVNHERLDFARVRRSLYFIKRINSLVLADLSSGHEVRRCVVKDLMDDIELLLKKEVTRRGLVFDSSIEPGLEKAALLERSGSLFFIMRNLLKNGTEAVLERGEGATGGVRVRVTKSARGVEITVADDGVGMDGGAAAKLIAGESASGKVGGHGLGFRFVVEECRRNGFELRLSSTPGKGTAVSIDVPTQADEPTPSGDTTSTATGA